MASRTKDEPTCSRSLDDLVRERAPLAALQRYLIERGHARHTVYAYLDRAAHFCHWAERTKLDLARTDEKVIRRFCDDHLGRCDCCWPTQTDPREASAALGHLLLVLRILGVAGRSAERGTPVDEELRRFDERMDQARGLAPTSRQTILRIVRELLWGRFHERPVVISAIIADVVLDGGACVHLHGKGRKQRAVPLWKSTVSEVRSWLRMNPSPRSDSPLFPNRSGRHMTRSNVEKRLALAVQRAASRCPSIAKKRISPHTIRHTTAMHLLQSGVAFNIIALWLGHESPVTTHRYVEADLAMKEKALARVAEPAIQLRRYRPADALLAFLQQL